jgi:hypothetical protein
MEKIAIKEGTVISVQMDVEIPKRAGGTYKGTRIILDSNGKTEDVNIGEILYKRLKPGLKGKLQGLKIGEIIKIHMKKGDSGFWNVEDIETAGGVLTGINNGSGTFNAPNANSSVTMPSLPTPVPVKPTGGKGVFPIPPQDGQRSIVRQNALTNARELYCNKHPGANGSTLIESAKQILKIATLFEEYTTGDMELNISEGKKMFEDYIMDEKPHEEPQQLPVTRRRRKMVDDEVKEEVSAEPPF